MKGPFFLNDVQYAFLIGRQKQEKLCGVSCHIIAAFRSSGIDEEKLRDVWHKLAHRHEVLSSRIMSDGTVFFSDAHDPDRFFTVASGDSESYINSLKNRLMDIEDGGAAELHLIKEAEGCTVVFECDCAAFDITSLQIFIRDMAAMYNGNEAELPVVPEGFFPYGEESHPAVPRAVKKADKSYWTERAGSFGTAPFEGIADTCRTDIPAKYSSHSSVIGADSTAFIHETAERLGVTEENVLLALFSKAAAKVCGREHFTLNIPVLDRSGAPAGLAETAADYTSIIMFDTDVGPSADTDGFIRKTASEYAEALEHRAFSGIKVQQLCGGDASGNVTFSSHIHIDLGTDQIRQAFGELSYIYTETPNVVMDSEFFRCGDKMLLNLSTPDGVLPEGTEERLISELLALMHS